MSTGTGETIAYDSLLIAVGARPEPVYRHAITFGAEGAPEALAGLLADLEDGYTKRVAFVVPSTVAWSLPLYELAVMTARDVLSAGHRRRRADLRDARGAAARGVRPEAASDGCRAARRGGHRVHRLDLRRRRSRLRAGGRPADRRQPHARAAGSGRPGDRRASRRSRAASSRSTSTVGVQGIEDVYAAGDATTFPIKQGGLAAQQAVAAAEAIVARHGADLDPQPFRPVLRGMLLTGGQDALAASPGRRRPPAKPARRCARCGGRPPRSPRRYLAPYLDGPRGGRAARNRPEGGQPVDARPRADWLASDERRQRAPDRDRLRRFRRRARRDRIGRCAAAVHAGRSSPASGRRSRPMSRWRRSPCPAASRSGGARERDARGARRAERLAEEGAELARRAGIRGRAAHDPPPRGSLARDRRVRRRARRRRRSSRARAAGRCRWRQCSAAPPRASCTTRTAPCSWCRRRLMEGATRRAARDPHLLGPARAATARTSSRSRCGSRSSTTARSSGATHSVREEVRLNRRLAPDVYLGVRAIIRDRTAASGSAAEDAPGAVEYAVEMRRYDEDATLARRLAAGTAGEARGARRSGGRLAAFHAGAVRPADPERAVRGARGDAGARTSPPCGSSTPDPAHRSDRRCRATRRARCSPAARHELLRRARRGPRARRPRRPARRARRARARHRDRRLRRVRPGAAGDRRRPRPRVPGHGPHAPRRAARRARSSRPTARRAAIPATTRWSASSPPSGR